MLQTKANNKFGTLTKRTKKVEDKGFNIEDYNYLAQKIKECVSILQKTRFIMCLMLLKTDQSQHWQKNL